MTRSGENEGESEAQGPLLILLVEDDRLDAELTEETLINEGLPCRIVRVETRADYLAALQEGTFDLIISDYSLPAFDGMTALRLAQETCPDLPFILISGRFGEELAVEALKSGATDYVLKQSMERFAPAVRRALQEAENRLARGRAEAALQKAYQELERRVQERTAELRTANESSQAEIAERQTRERTITEQAALLDKARDAILVRGLDGRIIYYQMLMNLCLNARDAMPDGGKLVIEADNIFIDQTYASMNIGAETGPHVVIMVNDTGAGIPPTFQK